MEYRDSVLECGGKRQRDPALERPVMSWFREAWPEQILGGQKASRVLKALPFGKSGVALSLATALHDAVATFISKTLQFFAARTLHDLLRLKSPHTSSETGPRLSTNFSAFTSIF